MASARSTMPMARSTPAQKPRGLASRTSMSLILGLLRGAGRTQPVEDQQRRPHRNRRIGKIESPEMPAKGMEVEKIHDVAEGDPVPQIAERSAEYQGKSRGEKPLARMPGKEEHDGGGRGNSNPDEQHPLPATRVGEKAEGRAAVVGEHQIEERRDLAHFAEAQARADRDLARLVRQGEKQRERKPRGDAFQILRIHANRRGSPEP